MNEEEYLKNLKQKYLSTEPPLSLKVHGWDNLLQKIGSRPALRRSFGYRLSFAFGLTLIVSAGFFGLFKIAQAAMPGESLYPVKLLSEDIIKKATGSNQIVIDNRAEEIVNLAQKRQKDAAQLKEVVIEYKKVVQETRQKIETSGQENKSFEQKLEEHYQEFDRVAKDSPETEREIKDAIEVSKPD